MMNLSDIHALYFITDISNVASIMRDGILSHNEARRIYSVAIKNKGETKGHNNDY